VARKGIPGLCVFRLTHYPTVYTAIVMQIGNVRELVFAIFRKEQLCPVRPNPTLRDCSPGFCTSCLNRIKDLRRQGAGLRPRPRRLDPPRASLASAKDRFRDQLGAFFRNRNAIAQAQAGTSRLIPVISVTSLTVTPRSISTPAR
jgi:hypothetical protein